MQPEKKQLEILIMRYFQESFADFPVGLVVPSESPDFLLKLKSKNMLGIELTRLNPGNASEPTNTYLQEINFQEDLIQTMLDIFVKKSGLKLFVKFLFSDKKKIAPEKKLMVAVHTVNILRKTVQHKNKDSFFKESILASQLPEGIEEILIVGHPKLEVSVWERSNNLGISNDVVDDIRNSIHKKDEKLRLYQKQHLNFYWLLITTDRLRGVRNFNLPNKIMNHKFESRFQHVFLFDLIKSDIYQLI
ncbi:MAG: hypothetical protein HN778_20815 [Prolixibacteraceae bacterium]|jgi:hypothetical protein|nr:hypothetical protein [Prolixibacteraceae bacterium]MBT6004705.1 hypothetical protein [Prolixibacteraceae bacterium]MBT6764453.1 hypothetical protein [Prolixibacteraceae bacterium]MBT6998525.1 hypothetical protein [Prolixibacteraceae bacterium]MBT7397278.1 hypothetical protein [Prolixibacteraceae bacterium]